MHIVFYGPEGSGKGTQARLLAQKLKLPILTSGDLVREAAALDKGIIGETCREALRQGKYVADSEMFVLWKRRLKEPDALGGWIMDGFPRNLKQAKFLDEKITKYGYKVEKAIYLKISGKESLKRLIRRARPLHPGSSKLHDSPRLIQSRLRIYKKGEKGVLEYYRRRKVLCEVDARISIPKVFQQILACLKKKE